ncbi:asparaginase [Rhodospirillum sp. A1_3_36]|uniref:asparaginase n=1 Tax=Rhodospirillum sp. A1_3_36 TaxID=3391666 RepID=UPI0039A46D58
MGKFDVKQSPFKGGAGLPKVKILSLGGTIACIDRGDGRGAQPTMGAEDLVRTAPMLGSLAQIEAVSPFILSSAEVSLARRIDVAEAIGQAVAEGVDAVIVTQGTDTLEDTAFALDLLGVAQGVPVVVTGAMRHASLPGADGPVNLVDAVRVALAPAARGLGVLVVMAGQVHGARFVRKVHTRSVTGFASSPFGALGWVGEDGVTLAPGVKPPFFLPPVSWETPLPWVIALPGDDPELFDQVTGGDQVTGRELSGLVLEGVGGGHVPVSIADRVEALVTRIPVVVTTRVENGGTLSRTYGYPGSELDLIARGAVMGGWLTTAKARSLLTLSLRAGMGRTALAEAFAAYSVG